MMKKALFFAGLAAAFAFVGCNKEADVKGLDGRKVEIVLTNAQTRTVNEGMSTKWAEGDALNVFYAPAGTADYSDNVEFKVTDVANNTASGTAELSENAYDWYVLYPYSSFIKSPVNTSDGYIYIGSRSDQSQVQTGYDSMSHLAGGSSDAGFPVYGIVKNVDVNKVPVIKMKQVASVAAVKVKNDTDKAITITQVDFTAPEAIVGAFYVSFEEDPVKFTNYKYVATTASLAVKEAPELAPGATATFYIGIKPFTAKAGDKLGLKVTADAGVVEKEVTLESAVAFESGVIKNLNIGYASAAVLPTITVSDVKATITPESTSGSPCTFEGKLEGAIVTFVSGSYAFIQDETGGIVLFKNGHGFNAGDKLEGVVSGSGYTYNGLKELTSLNVETITSGQTIPAPVELTLADLNANYARYESVRVTVKKVTVPTAFSNRNTTMTDGEETLVLRDQKNGLTITPGVYDITGYPSYFKAAQFGVWTQDDIVAVNQPFFNATAEETEVSATTTSVEINVFGNVAWTAEASDGATLDKASGEGEDVITVSFAENSDTENTKEYTVFVRTENTQVENDEFEINITQAKAVDLSNSAFVKVASSADLTDGQYLIVNEEASLAMTDAVDAVNNGTEVIITNGTIEATAETSILAFTVSFSDGFISGPNGKFIGQTSDANGMQIKDAGIQHTISITADGDADIVSGGAYLRFNAASNQMRFRYYKSTSYSGQKPIQLYKLSEGGGGTTPAVNLSSIAVSNQSTSFAVGDTFTFDGKVTASYTDGSTKDVTSSATVTAPDLTSAGTKEVTVSYTEGDVTKTATYTITVNAAAQHAGTTDDPYTVAEALAITGSLTPGATASEACYVKGIISQIDKIDTEFGNATYYISDNGSETDQFEVYRGYYLNGIRFLSDDWIQVGDEVLISGKLQNYKDKEGNTTPEITSGSSIITQKRDGSDVPYLGATLSAASVESTITSVTVNVYANVSWTATANNGASLTPASGSTSGTITLTFPENTDAENAKEYTVTVSSSTGVSNSPIQLTLTQKAKVVVEGDAFVKITSSSDLTAGEYLLVCDSKSLVYDGSLSNPDASLNYITLEELPSSFPYGSYSIYSVTIEPYETGYSIKNSAGKYMGRNANSNGIDSSDSMSSNLINAISFNADGTVTIAGKGGRVFNYNASSGKFRYFASSNTPLVYLYKSNK